MRLILTASDKTKDVERNLQKESDGLSGELESWKKSGPAIIATIFCSNIGKNSLEAPNNSFKPTPHRGVGHVLYATLARVRHPATGRLNSGVR